MARRQRLTEATLQGGAGRRRETRANAPAVAREAIALNAAGITKRGLPRLERPVSVEAIEHRHEIFHLPIADKRSGRFHLRDPIAEKLDRVLIPGRRDERRHLPGAAPGDPLQQDRPLGVAGREEHRVVDPESVMLWAGAEEIHLLPARGEFEFHFRITPPASTWQPEQLAWR